MTTDKIHLMTHNSCLLHEMGSGHPESPARLQVLIDELQSSSLPLIWHQSKAIPNFLLENTHASHYLKLLNSAAPQAGYSLVGPDALMNTQTLSAASHAAGSVIEAVDKVYKGEAKKVFCLVRPPGHHAMLEQAMGFCFINSLACGVLYAIQNYGAKRIGIMDFDVHHGNGTQNIIHNNPHVLFCSSFQYPFYPFDPLIAEHPVVVHMPLGAGSTGRAYRKQFEETILMRFEQFKPEILFVSAGFDAHYLDPIGGLNLDEEDYFWLGKRLMEIANNYADDKIISVLEGGYHLQALAKSVHAYMQGLQSN
ncbi:Histone deacetylase-like amidohydrolase [Legionella beliardensis]|uniref:Histone deacetylase-like amidohydrolase n=1 Tax=Legionella beliardensis TaxID=91822 RepID=A0A378I1T9_9GAMM|nr:histone deacetylase family protein [Legionella beliardensis]STX29139.1 Histone deacetylase-like amidohydrolase [Legionella beliardensis]